MYINPKIFKAYDIRGVYKEDFDDEMAYKLGLAYAKMRKDELKDGLAENTFPKIVVCCDMRISSEDLKNNLINGLLDGGVDVVDIGLASTPTFYFGVVNYSYDGGIMVSASHNPAKYNGFKIVRQKAVPVSGETGIMKLRNDMINNNLFKSEKRGELSFRENVLDDQIVHDLQFCNIEKIKKFKIVVDTANAMGSLYVDALFKNLPQCEIKRMFWELDGNFPNHEADPYKPENIKFLEDKVRDEKADLGIAIDGDGDRIFFVDNSGEAIDPGIIRAILSRIFLKEKPGSKICYDIRPGKITYDVIVESGGKPIVTRVGHSLIKEQAIKEGAYFAGESSGHFFLNMGSDGCYEVPVIVIMKILEELTVANQDFSEYIKLLKKYFHSGEINSRVKDCDAKIEEIKNKYKDGNIDEMDGVTIEYEDFWFNVRKSNTEPLLRLNLEARTKEVMEMRRDEVSKLIALD